MGSYKNYFIYVPPINMKIYLCEVLKVIYF